MNNPKISVIVPVYNAEQYLPKCIDSVLAQVEQDFEILLIDDGSTDGSGKICDDYQAKDSRIKVFHEQNGGVCSARNKGLDEAKGDWIFFIDDDDYIDENELTIPEEYTDADIITKPMVYVYGVADSSVLKINKKYLDKNCIYTREIDIWKTFISGPLPMRTVIWGRLWRSRLIGKHRFDTKVVPGAGEDTAFNSAIISDIHSYAFSNIGSYYYVQRSDSVLHTYNISLAEKFDMFYDNNGIKEWCKVRPIFVIDTIRNLSWILQHKYIRLSSQEQIAFIHDFLNDITEQDCVLFTKRDFKSLEKAKRKLHMYLNNKTAYGFVVFNEIVSGLLRNVYSSSRKVAKRIYFGLK